MEQSALGMGQGALGMGQGAVGMEPGVLGFELRRPAKKESVSGNEQRRLSFEEGDVAYWAGCCSRSKSDFAGRASDAAKTPCRSSIRPRDSGSRESVVLIAMSEV
jgi:hypothetical protein